MTKIFLHQHLLITVHFLPLFWNSECIRLGNADQGTLWVGRDLPPRGNI